MYELYNVYIKLMKRLQMKLRVLDILKEKGKSKYWLYIQLGLSYQNFNRMVYIGGVCSAAVRCVSQPIAKP